jgi:hypothetical protein
MQLMDRIVNKTARPMAINPVHLRVECSSNRQILWIRAKINTYISTTCSGQTTTTNASIFNWLLGADSARLVTLDPEQLQIADRAIDYRMRILAQRYLGLPPSRAYKNLMQRLAGISVLRDKIRAWLVRSSDRQRQVVDVLQEIVQEMIQGDKYIQQQIIWIRQCTSNPRLRDTLLFATIEEYCLRPIRHQPLIAYRFFNYLRRSQKGGVTNVPQSDSIKIVSDEIIGEHDASLNLLDLRVLADYQQQQDWAETQLARTRVKEELRVYLVTRIGQVAGIWLDLYLQGKTPESIALAMNLSVKQIYRLREKINYHTVNAFTLKAQPELVSQWLQISLQEHNLGLTPSQWEEFYNGLDADGREIMRGLKAGTEISEIAQALELKPNQVMTIWSQIYLTAQTIRTN